MESGETLSWTGVAQRHEEFLKGLHTEDHPLWREAENVVRAFAPDIVGIALLATVLERYALRLDGASDVTLDGQGSTFLLGPDVRFLRLRHSQRIAVRHLQVDFDPLPFTDGTVTAVNAEKGYLDVAVAAGEAGRLCGGPTKQDGEQAFFAMLWRQGAYGLVSRHYWTERMAPGPEPNTVRVFAGGSFRQFGDITPGEWRISLPVPGRRLHVGCVDGYALRRARHGTVS